MKILITGANGYVGGGLLRYLSQENNIFVPTGFGVDAKAGGIYNLDLTDFASTNSYIERIKPEIIIHLAGNKDVFKCESDEKLSRKINYDVSENIIKLCASLKTRLIYLSTDYVFGGAGAPFNESARTTPDTQYGKDKLATEDLIRVKLEDYAIIRSAGIFGLGNDFVEVVIRQLRAGRLFNAYTNLKNSPTFIKDLAAMFNIIIEKRLLGIFHCAGSESISRYDFALKIAKAFQLNDTLVVAENIDLLGDPRPSDLSMDSSRSYEVLDYYPQNIGNILKTNMSIWITSCKPTS